MMKEKLYTIPLNDALNENDECLFCNIERKLEQDAIDFTLGPGASYMESDIREQTDKTGFCRRHLKMMFEYGNSLGNALILKTRVKYINAKLKKEMDDYKPNGSGLFKKKEMSSLEEFLQAEEDKCYVCNYYKDTYERYIDTFFHLYKNDPDFVKRFSSGKGFCLHHLNQILSKADKYLDKSALEEFTQTLFKLTRENMDRIEEDISWFVDKFDYRNKDADWKNSKDAIPRTMQKLEGGYPADGPYKEG